MLHTLKNVSYPEWSRGALEWLREAPARLAMALIRSYQLVLSPLKPRVCRFHPSCSEYALRAIQHCGLVRGLALAGWRVLRCNPFSPGGYDPGPWSREEESR